jgi:uncharacterized protein YneF (UPF0154 family)
MQLILIHVLWFLMGIAIGTLISKAIDKYLLK